MTGGAGLLAAEGLVAGYTATDEILKSVDLIVKDREIVSIIGPNGAGKSTLLRVIAGLLVPRHGSVRLNGVPIHGRQPREISALGVAFVPQEQNVFPTMTVRENLEMGGYVEPRQSRDRIDAIFTRFSQLADKRRHAARTLSGGQRQILAMAMALMVEPVVLLLDEPSAGLAPGAAEKLFETIRAINQDGVAIAMVEQNALEALAIAHRGYILVDGRNSTSGPAPELARDPDVRRTFLGG